jgi:cytoskeletal protein CcmA (bactofilin family)
MRGTFALSLSIALLSALGGSFWKAHGAEIRSGEKVVIGKDEIIKDDLYVFGGQITIDGTVEGDVIAFGQQITVNGTVTGHVMAAGQTVVVTGESAGARIAGQVLKLGSKAKLDGDLLAAGLSLECEKESSVEGDALFAGYQALFSGKISDDLRGGMANCRLDGSIGGDVKVEVGNDKDTPPVSAFGPAPPVAMPTVQGGLTIGESAVIEGDVTYESSLEATIDEKAMVNGEVEQVRPAPQAKKGAPPPPPQNPLFTKTISSLKHLACVAIVGLLVLLVFPRWSTAWADTIRTRPAASFVSGLVGLAAFIALLVLAVVVIIVAAILLAGIRLDELVPMVIIGGMVGYAAMIVGFWLLAAFLAEALTGLAVGRAAVRDDGIMARLAALILGIVLLGLLFSVPFLGGIVGFVVLTLGIGSICLWMFGQEPPQSFAPLAQGKPMLASEV